MIMKIKKIFYYISIYYLLIEFVFALPIVLIFYFFYLEKYAIILLVLTLLSSIYLFICGDIYE